MWIFLKSCCLCDWLCYHSTTHTGENLGWDPFGLSVISSVRLTVQHWKTDIKAFVNEKALPQQINVKQPTFQSLEHFIYYKYRSIPRDGTFLLSTSTITNNYHHKMVSDFNVLFYILLKPYKRKTCYKQHWCSMYIKWGQIIKLKKEFINIQIRKFKLQKQNLSSLNWITTVCG